MPTIRLGRTSAPTLLVLMMLFAGCTQPPSETPVPGTDGAWEVGNDASDCIEHVAVLFVDPATAQAALPPGFVAADASAVLDLPTPTGKGAVFLNAVHCGDRSSAELAVPVEPPSSPLPPVRYSFYQLGYTSTNATLVALLQDAGFPAFEGTAQGALTVDGIFGQGSAAVDGSQEMAYSFEHLTSAPEPMDITARFWHTTEAGTIHMEYTIDASTALKGTATECTIGPASLLHQVVGFSDCSGQQVAVLAFPSQAWRGTVRFTPTAD